MNKKELLKRDSYLFGALLAAVVPVLSVVVFTLLNHLFTGVLGIIKGVNDSGIILLSLGMNLIAMRYYLVKFQLEKTGKMILAMTFIFVMLFFLFLHGKNMNLIPFN